jgi:hypothetical protein
MYLGKCHCGGVQFQAQLLTGLQQPARCNCSICRMRGAVIVFAAMGGVAVTAGAELLTAYQFNSNIAKHYFCSRCGVYTHHQRRFDPNQFAVNVACLTDVSPFDFAAVQVLDGTNHPADHGGGPMKVAGILRFERGD